jgi:hypothetical protein
LLTIPFILGTEDEKTYQSDTVTYFRKIMSAVNATELYGGNAE